MSAFDTGTATLFADPNLATQISYQAAAGGDPLSIAAIVVTPEDMTTLGGFLEAVTHGIQFAVQASAVAAPVSGDTITVASGRYAGTYRVQGVPKAVMLRTAWQLDTAS